MKTSAIKLLKWGFSGRYLDEDAFAARLRKYKNIAVGVSFAYSVFNFFFGLPYSAIVSAVSAILIYAGGYLIRIHRVSLAYILVLVVFNLELLIVNYFEGLNTGTYLFFFPCIAGFAFLADLTNRKITIFTYSVCVVTFVLCFLLCPDKTSLQEMSPEDRQLNFNMSVVASFALMVWMSFSLVRENYRKQVVLKDKEVFLDTIFNTSLYAELIVDNDTGMVAEHNAYAGKLFGLGAGTIKDRLLRDFFFELSQEGGGLLFEEMYRPGCSWEGELTCVRADGVKFPGSVHIASFQYHGKNYKNVSIEDITETRKLLTQLREAKIRAEESAVVKSQFLSNMSHELRTPLNGIIGTTNLLLQDECLPAQREQLNVLKFSSEHMLSLINDILDLSKLEVNKVNLERIAVDIPQLVHAIGSFFATQFEGKGLSFEIYVDPGINRPVLSDPTRLNQVLTNLLSNALKFTTSGGVKIYAKAVEIRSATIRVEFSVTDTGIGISAEQIDRIFGRFVQADTRTTRKYGGTGLGLTISQRLVQLMGGDLKVASEYRKGSRFYFEITLPVCHSRDKVFIDSKVKLDTERLRDLQVLIAEDNPVNMMIAVRFLERWGVKYEKAKNGLEAVSAFQKGRFDIILMDLEMPRMDGYTALAEIRKIDSSIPAIAFTAAVFENMMEKLTTCGFSSFIQKPFHPEDLYTRLAEYA